jgi:hypothetical protein
MLRIDEQTARAFVRLRAPDLAPITAYLKALRQDTLEQLAQQSVDAQVHRLQGRAEMAREILELIERAETLATKLKQQ